MSPSRLLRIFQVGLLVTGFAMLTLNSKAAAKPKLEALTLIQLPGWAGEDHATALKVLARSCEEILSTGTGFARRAKLSGGRSDWQRVCRQAQSKAAQDNPKTFLEENFTGLRLLSGKGQFTGYFEPEFSGNLEKSGEFQVPVLARPDDLVKLSRADVRKLGTGYGRVENNKLRPYHTRKQIEQGILDGKGLELAYLKSWVDLFFMQVQGSGRLRLPDGSALRLSYAAKSGLAYTSIGKVLIDQGELTREEMSMQTLRTWLEANPDKARQIMWQNQSYVFFRRSENSDPTLGPVGAQLVPLTPFRSLAIDRSFWALGVPLWISTQAYSAGKLKPFSRLMVAQDTGSAIKGEQRGDIFFGSGDKAGEDAGLMDQPGELYAIVPRPLAKKLLARFGK